jgi:peptidoglycan hydrolase-like protein with peptidoglycan-binding domain
VSIFSTISELVADYALWKKYEPVVDQVEAVLLKNGINVEAMVKGASVASDPSIVLIQQRLNKLGAGLDVDGILGPVTLKAISQALVKGS